MCLLTDSILPAIVPIMMVGVTIVVGVSILTGIMNVELEQEEITEVGPGVQADPLVLIWLFPAMLIGVLLLRMLAWDG